MGKSESSDQQEESSPSREPRPGILGFLLYSIVEVAVIGLVAFLIVVLFLPNLFVLGAVCIVVGLIIFTFVKIRLYSTSANLPVEDFLIGKTARALEDFRMISSNRWEGKIRVQGETWRAVAEGKVSKGDLLKVTAERGLCLHVKTLYEEV